MKLIIALFLALAALPACAMSRSHEAAPEYYPEQPAPLATSGGYRGDALDAPRPEPARAMAEDAEVEVASESRADFLGGLLAFSDASKKGEVSPPPPPPPPNPKAPPPPPAEGGNKTPDKPPEKAEKPQRLIIYTAQLAVLVPAVDVAVEKFIARAQELGGYLQNRADGTVTVRIPAEHFFGVVDELRKMGTVTQENIQAQDVTKQVFDTELRLQTAEESRKRLLKILENATRTEDILRIEQEVRRLTEEIELMKGQLRHLRDQVAFSTVAVTFMSNAPPPIPYPSRSRSRFEWINAVGVEQVLHGF